MSLEEKIKAALEKEFEPLHLEVINESAKHAGHAGDDGSGQTHFLIVMTSEKFTGKNRVQKHQMVNQLLLPFFDYGLHALSLRLDAPQ
ncbi:MAG: BolA family transcriptional regulator [Micavibrio sp.]|mgnify:CR=1 FL=1|nr:BolA family transcriptional regulator [Micavibrio sp.]|tara:strand:+ start:287 stop:550 length:264 start_codon:yes stop_codon:yes gene_type:complete